MRKSVKSVISSLVLLIPALSFAQTSVLSRVIARTDKQLSPSISVVAELPAVPAVSAPAAAAEEQQSALSKSDYFPLNKRLVLVYRYTSSEFSGAKTIRVEQLRYFPKDNAATFMRTTYYNGTSYNEVYGAHANQSGVYSVNGLLGGDRMEFSLPERVGSTWRKDSNGSTIESLSARVGVPAGDFSNCLKVTTELGGGDAGISERYYAPGIGLVYENVAGEAARETLKLVSYAIQ